MVIKLANRFLQKVGYSIIKNEGPIEPDIQQDSEFMELYEKCRQFTMTSIERMYTLYSGVRYVLDNQLPGDFVECGVWKGGSSMLIALILKKYNVQDRKLFMYDTFEGMSEPSKEDKALTGEDAESLLQTQDKMDQSSVWCYSTIDEVMENLSSTGFLKNNMKFVQGKVEDTLLKNVPDSISLLRLDTDWYESTKIELEILYPRLVNTGVLIIDDFGHWQGAKKAVLEYFSTLALKPFVGRIDYTGRIIIKP